ncbi:hypothetical protein CEXT_173101 [Caerostris extrusa]|uniref:Secreted protein n=1 Tax=Caerostris extrusa TaxID=172846 RepID=A0AAV4V313_CAEEX|nr:hypothetical protein CEXT_173101 [Caerostris extrusa]
MSTMASKLMGTVLCYLWKWCKKASCYMHRKQQPLFLQSNAMHFLSLVRWRLVNFSCILKSNNHENVIENLVPAHCQKTRKGKLFIHHLQIGGQATGHRVPQLVVRV